MSVQAMGWVFEHMPTASAGAKLVLLSIANHCGADGKDAWPSYATIAKESGLSRRQVIRCVDELSSGGSLVVHKEGGPARQGGATNLYEIPGVTTRHLVTDETESGDKPDREVVTNPPEVVSPMSPEPSLEPSIEPSRTALAPMARASDPIFEILFQLDAGLPYSNENRKTLTKTALDSVNAAAGEIRATDCPPDELIDAIRAWPSVMGDATCTAQAIKKHLPRLRAAANGLIARQRHSEFDDTLAEVRRMRATPA